MIKKKIKKILVSLDGSKNSIKGLNEAIYLAILNMMLMYDHYQKRGVLTMNVGCFGRQFTCFRFYIKFSQMLSITKIQIPLK